MVSFILKEEYIYIVIYRVIIRWECFFNRPFQDSRVVSLDGLRDRPWTRETIVPNLSLINMKAKDLKLANVIINSCK